MHAATSTVTVKRPRSDQAGPPHVFVVEDDPAALESFGALLESEGFKASLYPSCENFLSEAVPSPNSCLLLDARFHGMSGLELLDTLRREGVALPTVFVMGRFDAPTRTRAARFANVVAVLDKPVASDGLFEAVRTALTKSTATP